MTDKEDYIYCGQPLSSLSLWDLGAIEKTIKDAEARREEASQHSKFNMDREIGSKVVKKLDFPPPNPEFLKLKNAVELEIKKRQGLENA